MAVIEPVRKDLVQPELKKKYSASLRLWHRANALIINTASSSTDNWLAIPGIYELL